MSNLPDVTVVDLPLEVLLRTAHSIAPELPDDLVTKCYEIQRGRQFDQDGALRYELTEALLDKAIGELRSQP